MDAYHDLAHIVAEERERRRKQRRAAVILFVSIALVLGTITYALTEMSRSQPAKVVIDPAKLPPIRPGPQL